MSADLLVFPNQKHELERTLLGLRHESFKGRADWRAQKQACMMKSHDMHLQHVLQWRRWNEKSDQLIIGSHMCNYVKASSRFSKSGSPCWRRIDGWPSDTVMMSHADRLLWMLTMSIFPKLLIANYLSQVIFMLKQDISPFCTSHWNII